jgi:hypothetical protein
METITPLVSDHRGVGITATYGTTVSMTMLTPCASFATGALAP